MRDLPIEVSNQLNKRGGIVARNLLWVRARNRTTNEFEEVGFWNGSDVRQFVIGGATRTYYGTGAFITFGALTSEIGLVVRKFPAQMSSISPELNQVLRGYEAKFAPVEAHIAFFDPETNQLLADPTRIFKGWVDTFPLNTPKQNAEGSATINMVSNSRILTRKVSYKRSNETQKQRDPNDTFFKDVSITGTVQTPWGSN